VRGRRGNPLNEGSELVPFGLKVTAYAPLPLTVWVERHLIAVVVDRGALGG
jgi:hypothetical protein